MKINVLDGEFAICQLSDVKEAPMESEFCFLSRTDEEISYVCPVDYVPAECKISEAGWRAFRVEGILDFSLIGILAGISAALAEKQISIFVISTYNTDYVLVREGKLEEALDALKEKGFEIQAD